MTMFLMIVLAVVVVGTLVVSIGFAQSQEPVTKPTKPVTYSPPSHPVVDVSAVLAQRKKEAATKRAVTTRSAAKGTTGEPLDAGELAGDLVETVADIVSNLASTPHSPTTHTSHHISHQAEADQPSAHHGYSSASHHDSHSSHSWDSGSHDSHSSWDSHDSGGFDSGDCGGCDGD